MIGPLKYSLYMRVLIFKMFTKFTREHDSFDICISETKHTGNGLLTFSVQKMQGLNNFYIYKSVAVLLSY